MRIQVQDLAVGDIFALNDWTMHVIGIECDRAVAVLTAEFDFSIHFPRDEAVNVQARFETA